MADSIREQVLSNLVDAIRNETAVRTVERTRRKEYHAHELPAVSIFEGPERKEPGPSGKTTCTLPVIIDITLWDASRFAETANHVFASIVRSALLDRNRGGLAVDTIEKDNAMFIDEENPQRPIGGFRVGFEIVYRHAEDDPFLP